MSWSAESGGSDDKSSAQKNSCAVSLSALSEIQEILAPEKNWDSEAEMLQDMAEFRRKRASQ